MDSRKLTPALAQRPGHPAGAAGAAIAADLLAKARADPAALLQELASRPEGLSQAEADARLKQVGPNEVAREKSKSALLRLLDNIKDPLVILLVALGVISFLTGDLRAMVVIYRPYQLNLRLPDILYHAAGVRRLEQPSPVPHRLVRGVDLHANTDHPRDTHA